MLKELNEEGKKFGLRINRAGTQIMKFPWCEAEQIELDGWLIEETSSNKTTLADQIFEMDYKFGPTKQALVFTKNTLSICQLIPKKEYHIKNKFEQFSYSSSLNGSLNKRDNSQHHITQLDQVQLTN
ncbi:hypothetical protein KIN20_000882 [Parelaphostrongylus tenuis]|uniref:Uncharacterized protein n=1 Tax=Parelaphostrongylus tenuis TaxID=148309 RepID=A0AAD5QFW8_PARTN|nr:hypothetical protein KIN20_000882 [Parelaphostrongylus tenuis]